MEKYKYSLASYSILGTREEQQDSYYHVMDNEGGIALVCDGMGGQKSGRMASQMVVEKFKDFYEKRDESESIPSFYLEVIDILDEAVFNIKDENGERLKAGTTLLAATIKKDDLYWLSIGDSRMYILRDKEFAQITRDHNYSLQLNQQLEDEAISEFYYNMELKKGNYLISFIGVGGIDVMDVNHKPFKLQENDTILLTTDGLYKLLPDEDIAECLAMENLEEAVTRLIEKATQNVKKTQDNTTCIAIRIEEEPNS